MRLCRLRLTITATPHPPVHKKQDDKDFGHPQAPERSSASHLQSESNLQYPVSASTQLHTLQYLQNQNSSQNSIYTDSSKYNRAAARSGRAAYLLPSPYHLTTPGSTYEKLSLPEDTNQLRTLFDQMPKDEIREKVFVIVYVHSSTVGEIKGGNGRLFTG